MKLASLKHGRDGRLVVVSHDLTRATDAFLVAPTLQGALDRWSELAPRLGDLATALELDTVPSFRFHEHDCASPLPRSYLRLSAEIGGDRAQGEPTVRQGPADRSAGPRDDLVIADGASLHPGAGIAAVTGDVAKGASCAEAAAAILLVMLSNDPAGAPGAAPSFSPVAVTPDEFETAFADGVLSLPLLTSRDNHAFEPVGSGLVDLAGLVALAARTRPLLAGTIVEARIGAEAEPLRDGGTIRFEMRDTKGRSVLGAIERAVMPAR